MLREACGEAPIVLQHGAFLRTQDNATSEVPAGSARDSSASGWCPPHSAFNVDTTTARAFFASWVACSAAIAARSPHLAAGIAAILSAAGAATWRVAAPCMSGGAALPRRAGLSGAAAHARLSA